MKEGEGSHTEQEGGGGDQGKEEKKLTKGRKKEGRETGYQDAEQHETRGNENKRRKGWRERQQGGKK